MSTRMTRRITVTVAALAALATRAGLAAEEIVVHGDEARAAVQAREAQFRSEMKDFAQSLNEKMKVNLVKDIEGFVTPPLTILVAANEAATRG